MATAFWSSVMGIGFVGATANGLMFYALAKSKARVGGTKIVLNQMILDFVSSLMLIFIYAMKFPAFDYTGVAGSFLCKIIWSETPVWAMLNSSVANLVVLTIERYIKIVHSVFHRKHIRAWMYNVAIALTWLNFEAVIIVVVSMVTSEVVNGNCSEFSQWKTQSDRSGYATWNFVMNFIIPLVVFGYCYSRILNVLVAGRRINPVSHSNALKSASQEKVFRAQMSVVKTFLIVSICFVLCWIPNRVYFFLFNLNVLTIYRSSWRYITVFVAFLNICLNPFIYAANLDPVKKYLRNELCRGRCRKRGEGNDNSSIGNITTMHVTVAG